MASYILEACVDSVESAVIAQENGANRIELCANLVIGGTTPDINLFHEVSKRLHIPINVLIRPRFGDFLYTESEFSIMKRDAEMFARAGASGIVIGMLEPDGSLDTVRMEALMTGSWELMRDTGKLHVTLHRAFDLCRDPMEALEQAKGLGVTSILTSGQANTCTEGKVLLRNLVDKANGDVEILIGGGVNADVIRELAPYTGSRSFHMSGKEIIESGMTYRRENVSMGVASMSEYEIWRTDGEAIAAARDALN